MYIDGVRTNLSEASCSTPAASAGYPCESPLPTMSNGQHTVQLASYFDSNPIAESPKSASLVITMTGASGILAGSVTIESTARMAPVTAPVAVPVRNLTTADGARLRIDVVAQVDQPAALAVSGDGAVLVADRSGVVRVVRDGRLAGETSVGVDGTDRGSILDLALDPQFPTSHWVYVLDVTAGDAPGFRVSRFREAGGRLGERAVLLDAVPASPGRPSALAFGSDGRLCAAFDDGGNPTVRRARRPTAAGAAIERRRLHARRSEGATPITRPSLQSPRSLAWIPRRPRCGWLTAARVWPSGSARRSVRRS
jgi:glucose/arabinose dehydrogenase